MSLADRFSWYEVETTRREDILIRVLRGTISPEQAEAEAVTLGIEPFAKSPDISAFDPNAEAWWSLSMTAAWIIWRSDAAVREVWREFRREVRQWHGPLKVWLPVLDVDEREASADPIVRYGYHETKAYTGYELEKAKPLSLLDVFTLALRAGGEENVFSDVTKARRDLWDALQMGRLIAEGIPRGGVRRPIRDAEWLDLDHLDCNGWPEDAIGSHGNAEPCFYRVRVRRTTVKAIWPFSAPQTANSNAASVVMRRGRRTDIIKACTAAYPKGVPDGTMVKTRDRAILAQLKANGLPPVSEKTIRRILCSLRS